MADPLNEMSQALYPPTAAQGPLPAAQFLGGGAANALGLTDAVRALQGQFTPEEAQMFALGALPGLIPAAKPEQAAAKTLGELFPHLYPEAKQGIASMTPKGALEAFHLEGNNPAFKQAVAPKPQLTDAAINAKLADNPGASIFDVAGVDPKKLEVSDTPLTKAFAANVGGVQVPRQVPPDPIRQELIMQHYPTRVYHGSPGFNAPEIEGRSRFYMTESPELASMYSGVYPHDTPDSGAGLYGGQVVPLQLDTSKFHVYDAAGTPQSSGEMWTGANSEAIHQAHELGAPGVTVKNVFDEPSSSKLLGQPQTLHILFPQEAAKLDKYPVRSPFAAFKDFSSRNLLAGLAGGAVAAPALFGNNQDMSKALSK